MCCSGLRTVPCQRPLLSSSVMYSVHCLQPCYRKLITFTSHNSHHTLVDLSELSLVHRQFFTWLVEFRRMRSDTSNTRSPPPVRSQILKHKYLSLFKKIPSIECFVVSIIPYPSIEPSNRRPKTLFLSSFFPLSEPRPTCMLRRLHPCERHGARCFSCRLRISNSPEDIGMRTSTV